MTFEHTHCLYMYCIAKYTYWRQENLQMGSSVCGGVWVWGGGGVGGGRGVWVGVWGGGCSSVCLYNHNVSHIPSIQ